MGVSGLLISLHICKGSLQVATTSFLFSACRRWKGLVMPVDGGRVV